MFKEQLWITRKSRYNTEERLLFWDTTINWLLTGYSVFFAVISIFPKFVVLPPEKISVIDWVSVSSSLIVLVLSLLVAGRGYAIRALRMKDCYSQLETISGKLDSGIPVDQCQQSYNDVLRQHENHLYIDFARVCLWERRKNPNGSFEENLPFVGRHLFVIISFMVKWIALVLLAILPLIVFWKLIGPYLVTI